MTKIDWHKSNIATVKTITVVCPCGKTHRLDPKHVHFGLSMDDGGGEYGISWGKVTLEYWCPHNLDSPLRSLKAVLYEY